MNSKISYSQCGEDMIADFVFNTLGIAHPIYIDVGAHHPIELNNTYYFYTQGSMGICIEPNPELIGGFKSVRNRDICLNIGVGSGVQKKLDYYTMSSNTLNTFSKEKAMEYVDSGQQILNTTQIDVFPINYILQNFFKNNVKPNFVSIDTEGLELAILKEFDFNSYRPEVFCVETISYSAYRSEQIKDTEISEYMKSKGYLLYADTYINSLFVDYEKWMGH